MIVSEAGGLGPTSRLGVLLEHFARIEDPRDVRRILHPLPEVLRETRICRSCGAIFPTSTAFQRALADDPDEPGRSGAVFRDVHGLGAHELSTAGRSRRHRRQDLPSPSRPTRRDPRRSTSSRAFATTSRLALEEEAVPDKANELTAIPALLERLGDSGGLAGALVSIDVIATTPPSRPTLRTEIVGVHTTAHLGGRSRADTRCLLRGPHRRGRRSRRLRTPGPRGQPPLGPRRPLRRRHVPTADRSRGQDIAVVRHFAPNLVRLATDRRSIETRRKRAGWSDATSPCFSKPNPVNLDSEPGKVCRTP